ncbi:MAG TPA: DsrE family protein [Chloroflexota bacterium]|nr:DsrE family protein [Chloroflexota bacterium]
MTQERRAPRLALVVKSDTFEDFLLALSWAGIAADSDLEVSLFFTNRAARRLHRDGFADIAQAAPDDPVGAEFIDRAEQLGFTDLRALLRQVKESGRVRVYVCSRAARIYDLRPDNLLPEVDSVLGTATFLLNEAQGADILMTI